MAIFHTNYRPDHADFRKKRKKSLQKLAKVARSRPVRPQSTKPLDTSALYGNKYRRSNLSHIPSLGVTKHIPEQKERYEGEMLERELAAQQEIERKKQCVAPAYNKGNLTFIATEEQAKWVGKK